MKFLIITYYGTRYDEAESFEQIGNKYPDALAIIRLVEESI